MDKLDHLGWVVQHTYEIGGVRHGIRSTSIPFAELLDEVLAGYRSSEEAPPFFSIVIGESEPGAGKQFHILYRGTTAVVRSLDLRAVASCLLSELHAPLFTDRDDTVYLGAGLASWEGRSALVPEVLHTALVSAGRRVKRAGLRLSAELWSAVDPASGRVIPAPRLLDLPDDAIERLAAIAPGNGWGGSFTKEPVTIDAVCILGATDEMPAAASRGTGVAQLAGQTVNLPTMGVRALEGLTRLVQDADVYRLRYADSRELLEALLKTMRPAV